MIYEELVTGTQEIIRKRIKKFIYMYIYIHISTHTYILYIHIYIYIKEREKYFFAKWYGARYLASIYDK